MKKPDDAVLGLHGIGWIHGIYLEQKQTGTDTAQTFCKISGSNGRIEGPWCVYESYLDVRPSWNSIAELKQRYENEISSWLEFEKKNKEELALYEKLKQKFEAA